MRILHTMLRCANLESSLAFYTHALDMMVLRRKDFPEGRFSLVYLGYGSESESCVLELTHNWDKTTYTIGDAYGHIALEVDCAFTYCQKVADLGYNVKRPAGPMKLDPSLVIAFVEDPDGYLIELIQKS